MEDDKVCFTNMHEDINLENGVGIQVNQLNFVVAEEVVKEITGRKTKSSLEEGG
jgi:phosphorylcholine metabolism protein LicD